MGTLSCLAVEEDDVDDEGRGNGSKGVVVAGNGDVEDVEAAAPDVVAALEVVPTTAPPAAPVDRPLDNLSKADSCRFHLW